MRLPGLLRIGGLAALLAAVCAVTAQDGKKPRKEEEDEVPVKKPVDKPKKKEEEEEKPRPGKSGVLDVDDDDKGTTPAPRPAASLAEAAREAKHPAIKALYESLATPADTIEVVMDVVRKKVETLRVQPIPHYITTRKDVKAPLTVQILAGGERTLPAASVQTVRYHEQRAGDEVRNFLAQKFDELLPDDRSHLTRYQMLLAAETALSAVIRFHQSAREVGTRPGAEWYALEILLRKQLVEVLLGQMGRLVESKSWHAAFELTRRLAEASPRTPGPDTKRVNEAVAGFLGKALEDPAFSGLRLQAIRERMRQLESLFPDGDVGRPIVARLRSRAAEHLARAEGLVREAEADEKKGDKKSATDKKSRAIDLLGEAIDTWPDLPGLREFAARVGRGHQILRVAVREQPVRMSPGWAVTDSETRVLDLLFESLVQLVPDKEGRLHYRPQLAEGRPETLALGRRFKLPLDAKWSDGASVDVNSVRRTVTWLGKDKAAGGLAAWGEMLEGVGAGTAHEVTLKMKHGFLDPMALMAFKVLPQHKKPGDVAFALNPTGSGPFKFKDHTSDARGSYTSFVPNPHYGTRPGRARLGEVRFYTPPDAGKALADGVVDIAFDLTAEQVAKLDTATFEVPLPKKPGAGNRRIYYLAVNNRKHLLSEPAVRLALARAIPRDTILSKVFGKGLTAPGHVALNGPYPVASWASDPELIVRDGKAHTDPFDADLPRAKFKEGLKKAGGDARTELTLKYPLGDTKLAEAMRLLCDEVTRVLPEGVTLTPRGVHPHALHEDLERQLFDLAYCHHDYQDGSFWLWPVLGAAPGGGENFMGYTGPLVNDAQMAVDVRYFPEARRKAREIHRKFLSAEMPFIPLWQLTPFAAWRKRAIDAPPFEVQSPFARIGEWQVR